MTTLRPLIPELEAVARQELGETPEAIENGLREIRQFLDERPYIHARTDDRSLIVFLRGSKYDLEKVKEKVEISHKIQSQFPDFFKGRDLADEKYRKLLKLGIILPLSKTEPVEGPRGTIMRFTNFSTKEFKMEEIIKTVGIVTEIMAKEDDNLVIAGQVLIIDLVNAGVSHLLQFTPGLIKKLATLSQAGNPIRCVGIHFLNTPKGFQTLLSIYKSFLSDGLTLKVHSSLESLQQEVPKSILPAEYGGDCEDVDTIATRYIDKLADYRDYFIEQEKVGYDEKLAKEFKKKNSKK